MAKVAIIMGSQSDLPALEGALRLLKQFSVGVEVHVLSAHRTPYEAAAFASKARDEGFEVIIAAAGKAAHLPGVLAAYTTPVSYTHLQRAKLKDGWIAHYLSQSLPYEPGDRFNYDSGDTYLAGCMLRRATGQTVREYLTGRLFKPLGIRVAHWEVAPCGNQFGGGGLWLRTRDAAKLPLLYLNQGQWQGRQLVSAAYVARASAKQIDTFNPGDGGFGYGFQFWRGSHNSYRADGAYSQLGIVLPEKRAVVMINSLEKKNGQGILDTVWEEIFPRL